MNTQFGVTPQEILGHQYKLQDSNWSAWYLLWRYASDHGLLNKDIEAGTNNAENQKRITDRQLAASWKVVQHAGKELELDI